MVAPPHYPHNLTPQRREECGRLESFGAKEEGQADEEVPASGRKRELADPLRLHLPSIHSDIVHGPMMKHAGEAQMSLLLAAL